ncbi:sigma-54-dependent transcriptional regulator [Anaeromyxobacter diazotrophicus]|uniref:Acetoacetate metabolism regulatory protein AtoC n=1 Tax=Anaeromyxobacter diazotrophicus TaxID=2590199 RepID=A0A7I9VHN5_9BACT|nr:sigma-54 dependent transcriptional regulator [Anaeromyxobacter diazotrophicus]GEJ55640.1 acetoacetate metabolism regulatory protein AtoC [Anaeromyxobacter diazotrophicus]
MAFRSVLIADDEESMRHLLTVFLRDHGYEVRAVANGEEALKELQARDYDLVLSDVRMPRLDGLALLREAQRAQPELTFIVMSAYGSHDAALEAMKAGAYDYVSKPFKPDEVLLVLKKAEERQRLWRENRRLRTELAGEYRVESLVGDSAPMADLLKQVRKLAPVKTTVLLTGESGTGKELIARALHDLSPRAALPFVAVNCGAIPAELMESELFGHVKGAFTDAARDKKGLAVEADGGTLFLDEIGELPLQLQVKLLRFLQEEEVRPVGGTRSERVDVRVVAATARDLPAAVQAGRFREDLYYRLDVVGLRLPPLRERAGDIPALARHFLARFASLRPAGPLEGFAPEALAALEAYRWPGNVRELEHAMERAAVLSEGPLVREDDLPEVVRGAPDRTPPAFELPEATLSVKRATRAVEEQLIRKALAQTGGNRTRAAELLELSYRALLYKIKEYGISG